jgi:hypothetical protein
MGSLWKVSKNHDGTFDLLRDGLVLHHSIPDKWLADQLVKYGLTGPEYREVRDQLNISAVATLDFR